MDYQEEIIAQEAVYHKSQNPMVSGYFDDQFENPKNFPQIPEYHFRIEDPNQALQLRDLYQNSHPLQTGFIMPRVASQQFCGKVSSLLSSIDAAPTCINPPQQMQQQRSQTHGFYTLKDDQYDVQKALEAAYQHLQLQNLNRKMQELKIASIKFKPRTNKKMQEQYSKMQKQVTKKIKKLRIQQQYQL